jgi:hypothetical protein
VPHVIVVILDIMGTLLYYTDSTGFESLICKEHNKKINRHSDRKKYKQEIPYYWQHCGQKRNAFCSLNKQNIP